MSSAAPSSSSSSSPRQQFAQRIHRGARGVQSFWSQVTEGIKLQDLWAQFRSEARSSYGLYSREVDWEKIGESEKWQRPFRAAGALFWALLMKLSPARRVLLLLAVASLLIAPMRYETDHGNVTAVTVGILSPGVLLLFLLLALELADRVTMKRDLEIAREIQRWLVPEKPPEISGLDIAFLTRPANTVAGDYYDTIPRGAARDGVARAETLLLVVADVAGKSVPAALVMATFQASLRAIEAAGTPLDEIVRNLNYYVWENSRDGLRFITAFFAELEPSSGGITYTSAGHHPALVRRTTGEFEELGEGGLPLGIEADEKFPAVKARLEAGELLIIYTDGLVEAVNAAGQEFGKSRLRDVLRPCDAGDSAQEVLRHITRVLDGFVGTARQHDDITCLVVRRLLPS